MAKRGNSIDPAIGDRIVEAREKLDLTQEELAAKTGLSAGYVGQLEAHHYKPGRDALEVLSRVLGESIDFLLHGSEKRGPLEEKILHLLRVLGPDQVEYLCSLKPEDASDLVDRHQLNMMRSNRRKRRARQQP